jgi:hypothetical protein
MEFTNPAESTNEVFQAHYGGQYSLFPPDENDLWNPQDIQALRCGILKESLRQVLDGRESPASRAEALDWLWGDDEGAFSAKACCDAEGVNLIALRDLMKPKIERGMRAMDEQFTARHMKRQASRPQDSLEWREAVGA